MAFLDLAGLQHREIITVQIVSHLGCTWHGGRGRIPRPACEGVKECSSVADTFGSGTSGIRDQDVFRLFRISFCAAMDSCKPANVLVHIWTIEWVVSSNSPLFLAHLGRCSASMCWMSNSLSPSKNRSVVLLSHKKGESKRLKQPLQRKSIKSGQSHPNLHMLVASRQQPPAP